MNQFLTHLYGKLADANKEHDQRKAECREPIVSIGIPPSLRPMVNAAAETVEGVPSSWQKLLDEAEEIATEGQQFQYDLRKNAERSALHEVELIENMIEEYLDAHYRVKDDFNY